MKINRQKIILTLCIATILIVGYFGFSRIFQTDTLDSDLSEIGSLGESVKSDLIRTPAVAIAKANNGYEVSDSLEQGIQIEYSNQADGRLEEEKKAEFKINFPADYAKPIEVKLDGERAIQITDANGGKYDDQLLTEKMALTEGQDGEVRQTPETKYLKYSSGRKSAYYAYQKDQAQGERKLKHWTVYQKSDGQAEQESYVFQNAKLKPGLQGEVQVYYFGDQQIQNEKTMADVEPSLLERAQRTIQKEAGEDILNNGQKPDFIIPEPYYIDKDGKTVALKWEIDAEKNSINLNFTPGEETYPIALDPTLQFTVPGQSNTATTIDGEISSSFGFSMTSGDFNADGRLDLVVGAQSYSSNTGRVYIFYNNESIPSSAVTADVIIDGESAGGLFGHSFAAGDFNNDGRIDLAVSAHYYSSEIGRVYVFYNDGYFPATSAAADVEITGESAELFGYAIAAGDFNADGKTDLAVGANWYSSNTGRAYIFYNDGSIPTDAASADVIITGEATSNYFGRSIISGDFNADGKTDLAVGSLSVGGRICIFYNDGSYSNSAATADVVINAETSSYFGQSITVGDFNADGKTDLAVGAYRYSTDTGRAYIFYADGANNFGTATCTGSLPTVCLSADADVVITGETTSNYFGVYLTAGDFNADGKTDLAVGANSYSSSAGRAYIFYNDGSIPTAAASADVIITGENSSSFGLSMTVGDFNADGKVDLVVGANSYSSSAGRAYIFYSQNGQVNTNLSITGEASSYFGMSLESGDFNSDGRIDLAVGAYSYSSSAGRVYIFYNDGSISTSAASADIIIDGEALSHFGASITAGDFNADSRIDLAVGAHTYSSNAGRAYIFYNDGSIPTSAASADVIIDGEASSYFGWSESMAAGDFNTDGRTDLAVGGYGYSSSTGRAYIFYNDGSIPTSAASADVIMTGEAVSSFGHTMVSGDFNADSRIDLAVGAHNYSSSTGSAYIFYNDGSYPSDAASADVIITGEASLNHFGYSVASGDFNTDGRTDLAIGAYGYSSVAGRTYIFHNDGSIPTTAASADVIIDGEASSRFGSALAAGDFNVDGKTDLSVGANIYSSNAGRAYIFYSDGSIPTSAASADIIITGEVSSYFGYSMAVGDFNADGKTDLAIGAYGYATNVGRVYIYETRDDFAWQLPSYSTGMRVNNVAGDELKITGESSGGYFGGGTPTAGDFNSDGRVDLAVGAYYANGSGKIYIFYNDGSISNSAALADVIITGEASSRFGVSIAAGDFNSDGRMDLAVGGDYYITQTGRTYIFYNDGSYPTEAASADAIITGTVTTDRFGQVLATGDFNSDGRTDLAVGAPLYGSNNGRAYIFYNDGSYPAAAIDADIQIAAEGINDYFAIKIAVGDLDSDGIDDLIIGAYYYNSYTGRAYIFYNDGSIPTLAADADAIITGEGTLNNFGTNLACSDFNSDGRTDLIVSAPQYATYTGRAYIFYNDGSIPTSAADADVIITGESIYNNFSSSFAIGDFNSDGRADLAVGAIRYNTYTGRAYIFYNDGSIPALAADADVILEGETTDSNFGSLGVGDFNSDGKTDLAVGAMRYLNYKGRLYIYTFNDSQIAGASGEQLGASLVSGDFNADGRTDLAVGARAYSTNTGRVYIFYNDGSMPTAAASADTAIDGETTSNYFGRFLAAGDFNADGRTDLAVGASWYSVRTGRAYIFYNDGSYPASASSADATITGEATDDYFGISLAPGDFNSDGKVDLAVGAQSYADSGRVYIFYNDGSYPTEASSADAIITGESGTSGQFGTCVVAGDFNADGRTDLAVGANLYSTNTGQVYIFYNDGSMPTEAVSADAIIAGEAEGNYFGWVIVAGDFNADGRTDLAVAAQAYATDAGRAYIFYNDGSYSAGASSADITITGQAATNFGTSLTAGDFNADGKTDLAVGAQAYSTNTGRVYIFYTGAAIPVDVTATSLVMTGEAADSKFGSFLSAGDFNADGKTDLAVGANGFDSNAGKFYIYITEAKTYTIQTGTKINGTIKLDQGQVLFK